MRYYLLLAMEIFLPIIRIIIALILIWLWPLILLLIIYLLIILLLITLFGKFIVKYSKLLLYFFYLSFQIMVRLFLIFLYILCQLWQCFIELFWPWLMTKLFCHINTNCHQILSYFWLFIFAKFSQESLSFLWLLNTYVNHLFYL